MKTRDVARATLLTALAVALSPLSIPVGVTRAFPAQHMINVIAAVLLGPWYAALVAFATSVLRNLLGTGTINAFAGSMFGALLAGLAWRATRNVYLSALGEVLGTGVLGALVTVYIVAPNLLGRNPALSAIGLIFLASSVTGAALAVVVLRALAAAGYLRPRGEDRLAAPSRE